MQQLSSSRGNLLDMGTLDRALQRRIEEEQNGEDGTPPAGKVNEFNANEEPRNGQSPELPYHLQDPQMRDKKNQNQGADSRDFSKSEGESEDDDNG